LVSNEQHGGEEITSYGGWQLDDPMGMTKDMVDDGVT
jgi:hypothetical protein